MDNRTYWEFGVCYENMERMWGITESPQNVFWARKLYVDKYQALTSLQTLLSLSEAPSRVEIFLDYEAGTVSYSVAVRSLIYTLIQASFSGPFQSFFCLWFYYTMPSDHLPLRSSVPRLSLSQISRGDLGPGVEEPLLGTEKSPQSSPESKVRVENF